jgi:site-specific recombinase XerD
MNLQVNVEMPLTMRSAPEVGHAMGPVADDWEAAEVWLRAVARKSGNGSVATVNTYGYHLAKLRWYCENVLRITPSRWSMQEVEAFYAFLENLPEDAICAPSETGQPQGAGQAGYTPFRKRPARSSQADIRRFVHALFKAWHSMGYIRINPMALTGSLAGRKIKTERSLSADVFNIVLDVLAAEGVKSFTERQRQLRDRFILLAFKELGLRAGELVGASMGAFYQLYDPASKKRYWIFLVTAETGKGAKERRIPVTRSLLASLAAYRESFGLTGLPLPTETTALLLSPRTQAVYIGGKTIRNASDRRFFGAWTVVGTRQGLYKIVKARLAAAAAALVVAGEKERAVELERASPHWLRHTFAKSALLGGQSMREVASLLGHASIDTTMIYTDQDAIDLARALERQNPDNIAVESVV